jgi:hypothetical protein
MTVKVTCEDTETGVIETRVIENDAIVITAGNHYVDGITKYANGTQIYTIKVDLSL